MARLSRRLATLIAMLAVISVVATVSVSASKASGSFKLVKPGTLTVAVSGTDPPGLTISGTKLGGPGGDVVTGFAKAEHLKLKLFETTFASVILAVEEKKVDLGMDYFYSTARAQQVYYTLPYFQSTAGIFTLKATPYKGISSLSTMKIAAVTGELWAPYLQKLYGSNVLLYSTDVDAATALLNGQVQAFVDGALYDSTPPLSQHLSEVAVHLIKVGQFGMPTSAVINTTYNFVACSNKGLADAYDKYERTLAKSARWKAIFKATKVSGDTPPVKPPTEIC